MTVIPQPYKCNVCGKYRDSDTNHWWLIWVVRLQDGKTDRVEMQLWNDELAREPGMGHCCGLKCALGQAASITQTILEQEMNATKSEEKTDG